MKSNRFFPVVVVAVTCCLSAPVFAQGQGNANGVPDAYIVQVADDADAFQVGAGAARATGGTLGHVYTNAVRGFSIRLPPGLARTELLKQRGVVLVEPDLVVHTCAQTVPTGIRRINASPAAESSPVDVDIAIIDTGIDTTHPDLNVVGGKRFYTKFPWSYEDDKYNDDNGHGSHVAGIAAARNNTTGVVGVAPGARLWAVKVLDSKGSGYVSDIIKGIDWVTANAGTIEVANMSLGGQGKVDAYRTAIQNSVAKGVVYVVAAGNSAVDVYGRDGTFNTSDDYIPAAYPEVATISAMADSDGKPGGSGGSTSYGADDSFASFSNYSGSVVSGNPVTSSGAAIDLLLPGVAIYSTYKGGGYTTMSGTSMASPHGAGLAALYIAKNGRASNADGVYAIRQALIDAGQNQASGNRLASPATEPDSKPEPLGWVTSTQTEPPSLLSIALTPTSASIEAGGTQQFAATGTYSDNTTKTITSSVTWNSSNTEVATIDSSGMATGVAAGTVAITASSGTIVSNEAQLTVTSTSPSLVSIAVTPTSASIEAGGTQQFAATGTYSDNTTKTITSSVTWNSSNTEVATIDSSGMATGVAAGTVAITASSGTIVSNEAQLTVTSTSSTGTLCAFINSIELWERWAGKNCFVTAVARVVIEDGNGSLVSGASVTGVWSGAVKSTSTGTTDEDGFVMLTAPEVKVKQGATFVLDITGVAMSGYEFDRTCGTPSKSATWPQQ